jgi:sirohydrochlorin cobaltochelatase
MSGGNGLVLFAHGARDAAWAGPFNAVLDRVRGQRPELTVTLAYLELMQPDLSTAIESLVRAGCLRIDVVPLFLGAGGHVKRDLPLLVEQLRRQHAAVSIALQPTIGDHPDVIEAIARAAAGPKNS